ncbi:MarR family winged helix-turn-helix transcriptional regulator [Roseomonas sp. KE0001]|uniref:MarR family winged helix-turn-helix transcriptional regulator n=1 Tax=Roseomonas sp. KE0001 TaxID=2479201 RepID=UPI0018DF42DE|nr:MarR family transcriptional regulator [Roseomonas sp. KE0001]MBI0432338.1 MarR family transcriptional regulator [Roseomonas sp. KE0001]
MTHSPEQLRQGFGSLLAQIARQWRRWADNRLQRFGLTEATWLPLLRIARAEAPMRQKDLARSLALDGSSVVRLVDALEAAGLVERRGEEGDRRARVLVLTDQGRATVAQVEQVARAARETALAGLDEAELVIADRVLRHIGARLAAEAAP